MKKLLGFILLLSSLVMGATYFNGTTPQNAPVTVTSSYEYGTGGFAYFVLDAQMAIGDTIYTQAFDMFKIPLLVGDSVGKPLVDTTKIGNVVLSCYDVTDSAAVTDSVIVSLTTQQSLVASDGLNPLRAGSTAWDSVNNVTITKASDVNLVVTTVLRPPLKTIDHRFIRWRLVNNGAIAKNIPRCRITYTRKGFAR